MTIRPDLVSATDSFRRWHAEHQEALNRAGALESAVQKEDRSGLEEACRWVLDTLAAQAKRLGKITGLIADTGFCSETNITACETAGIAPLIAVAKEDHHPDWRERHSEPPPPPENATPLQTMAHRLKTKAGRALYALRKQTVEPVFGIIKSVMEFRQFSLRGLTKVTGEWTLVCLAWNLKRLAVLRLQE